MKKKIYLSGAMGCYLGTKEEGYAETWRKETEKEFQLTNSNFNIFNSTRYYNYNEHSDGKEVMRYELNQLKTSDILLVNLKDVDSSVGTIEEIFYAYILGLPIIGFLPELDNTNNTFVHPWLYEQIDKVFEGKDSMQDAIYYIEDYYGE